MRTLRALKKLFNHFLLGTNMINWFKVLANSRFRIKPSGFPKALLITLMTVINLPIYIIDELFYSLRIKNTPVEKDPVFIIGHWRSGTTYLVNLMSRDSQFSFFDIIETFYPYAYTTLYSVLKHFQFIIPKERPMDKVVMNLQSPQEEDFAMANINGEAIAMMTVFPEDRHEYARFGVFDDVTENEKKSWKHHYMKMVKKMTYRYGQKPLLIKSPGNTCKIEEILEMFPNAKFIHMYRNPYDVCTSTYKMYKTLFPLFSLQGDVPDDQVVAFQVRLYDRFWKKYLKTKDLIPESNLVEIRYEDFIQDPMTTVKHIYDALAMEGFDMAEEKLAAYVASQENYQPRSHKPFEAAKAYLNENCNLVFQQYGYNHL